VSRAIAILLGLFALGCVENAILELQIQLPAAPEADPLPWFVQLQIRDASGHPFDIPWMGDDGSAVELEAAPRWECISVTSNDDTLDLHVRVRFCRSDNCLDLADGSPPERLYSLEHPFYIGRRTYYQITVPGIPDCMTSADCMADAEGVCIEGNCNCNTDADCDTGHRCEPGAGCVELVGLCEIEGCIGGVSAIFCSMDTGRHFCETNKDISRDDTYMCALPE